MAIMTHTMYTTDFINDVTSESPFHHVESSDANTTELSDYVYISFRELARGYCKVTLIYLNHVVIFSLFTLFGLVGNIALLSVILRTAGLRNSPNILLINLTVADLLYMLIATPFSILHEVYPCWLYGSIACKFKHYLPIVGMAVSIFSLAALSRERYNAIVRGLESRISRSTRRTLLAVASTWFLGLVIASPIFTLTRTTSYGLMCQYLPMSLMRSKVYIISQFVLLYILPLVFIAVNYIRLARSLCSQTMMDLAQNQTASNPIQARKRLAQIVLVITILFGILWFPYFLYFLWFVFVDDDSVSRNRDRIRFFRHFYYYMSLANSCLNPWVVFVMSSAHRRSIVQCLRCVKQNKKDKENKRAVRYRGISARVSTSSSSCTTVVSKI